MIGYILGTVVVVFGGVALLIFLALSSNRGASISAQTPAQNSTVSSVEKTKWYEYLDWAFFVLVVLDLWRKFVFPNVPFEWKAWIPGFSWNTVEIIIAVVGVYFLLKKTKKTAATGTGTAGSGITVAGVPYAHNPPSQMYGGVDQIKWKSSVGDSLWNAIAIPTVAVALIVAIFYFANEMTGLANFLKWVTHPVKLSAGMMFLLLIAGTTALLHKGDCFPVLLLGILGTIIGRILMGPPWFAVYNGVPWWMGTTVPAVIVVLPVAMLSCYTLWKNDFSDFRVPGIFLVLLFFIF